MTEANILNQVQIGKQTDMNTPATVFNKALFGEIISCNYKEEDTVTQIKPVRGGSKGHLYSQNVTTLRKITGTLKFVPFDFSPFQLILGDESSSSSPFTKKVTSKSTIPVYLTILGTEGVGNESCELVGVAFNNMSISPNIETFLEVTCEFTALKKISGTKSVTTVVPNTGAPLTYNESYMKLGSTEISLDTFTISVDFKLLAKRNIVKVPTASKYYLSDIKRTGLSITLNGILNINTNDRDIISKDTDQNMELWFGTNKKFSFIGMRKKENSKELSGESDKLLTYSFDFVGLDLEVYY